MNDYKVETDSGIFAESISTNEMIGFGSIQGNFYKNNKSEFIADYNLEFIYDKGYFSWTREYRKLQDLLGNIMGFMDLIVSVFSLLIYFNSEYRLNRYIANKLIFVVDSDFKLNCKKNFELNEGLFLKNNDNLNNTKIEKKESFNLNDKPCKENNEEKRGIAGFGNENLELTGNLRDNGTSKREDVQKTIKEKEEDKHKVRNENYNFEINELSNIERKDFILLKSPLVF